MSTVFEVVQQLCLGFAETEEIVSHGFPHFKVRGKGFATYSLNHHGDGKVALLLNMGRETQHMLVDSAPDYFFVPPYSGTKGWLGIELNKGLSWNRVAQLTFDAYSRIAPLALLAKSRVPDVKPPTQSLKPEDIDPLKSGKNQKLLKELRNLCLALPESSEDSQFGNPAFRAGKKSFCNLSHREGKTQLQIWVGAERQLSLTSLDPRFRIPPYVGQNGWINLDITTRQNWQEIDELLRLSYEHFALKRMLTALAGKG